MGHLWWKTRSQELKIEKSCALSNSYWCNSNILEIGLHVCLDDFYIKFEYGLPWVKNKVTLSKYGKNLVNPLPHWKVRCYKFKLQWKKSSILMKLGTNANWTIAYVTACLNLIFLLPWQRRTSQNCQKPLFCIVFFYQNWF
jgi:hypothetical protein